MNKGQSSDCDLWGGLEMPSLRRFVVTRQGSAGENGGEAIGQPCSKALGIPLSLRILGAYVLISNLEMLAAVETLSVGCRT